MAMQDRAKAYREKADECRAQAARTPLESNKAGWLKVAYDWGMLADAVEGMTIMEPTENEAESLPAATFTLRDP
jgi:hypothetical protein